MKKILTFLTSTVIILSGGIFASCSKDDPEQIPTDETENTTDNEESEGEEPEPEPEPEPEEPVELDPVWIPFHLYEDSVATGTDGDFFIMTYRLEGLDSKTFERLSHTTHSEWTLFLTTGIYGNIDYGISFDSEDDFWNNYYGYDSSTAGIPYEIYYYEAGASQENPTLLASGGESDYRRPDTTYEMYSNNGFDWGFATVDPDVFYLDFGVDAALAGQNTYPYDENGAKYLFVMTLKSRDITLHPDLKFYAFVHADDTELDPPSIAWLSNPNFDTVTLSSGMTVDISVDAPAGIENFYVAIDCSSTLVSIAVGAAFGLEMGYDYDIITDETFIKWLTKFKVPCGEDIKGATHVDFELSELADYIYDYYNDLPTIEKIFVTGSMYVDVKVVDTLERTATARATLKFP